MQLVHPSRPAPRQDRLRRMQWVLDATGLSKSSVYELMREGRFPKSVRLSARSVGWSEAEILTWIEARISAARAGAEGGLQ